MIEAGFLFARSFVVLMALFAIGELALFGGQAPCSKPHHVPCRTLVLPLQSVALWKVSCCLCRCCPDLDGAGAAAAACLGDGHRDLAPVRGRSHPSHHWLAAGCVAAHCTAPSMIFEIISGHSNCHSMLGSVTSKALLCSDKQIGNARSKLLA